MLYFQVLNKVFIPIQFFQTTYISEFAVAVKVANIRKPTNPTFLMRNQKNQDKEQEFISESLIAKKNWNYIEAEEGF